MQLKTLIFVTVFKCICIDMCVLIYAVRCAYERWYPRYVFDILDGRGEICPPNNTPATGNLRCVELRLWSLLIA